MAKQAPAKPVQTFQDASPAPEVAVEAPAPTKHRYRVSLPNVKPDELFDLVEADSPDDAYTVWKSGRGIRTSKQKPEIKPVEG